MSFGELVAVVGAVELVALLVVLAASLTVGDPPPRPEAEPPEARPEPGKVEEAA